MNKLTVGIALDSWKKDVFHERLIENGFSYEQTSFNEKTLFWKITVEDALDVQRLGVIIQQANSACARSKMN